MFFRRAFRRAGKKWRGLGGGNFCPRAEAKPCRPALWARKPKQKSFLFLFLRGQGGIPPTPPFRHALAKNRGQSRHPARWEQNPAKKFSFPFRRKNLARANQEKRRKLFCWVASGSERRRAGFLSSVQSRFVQSSEYPTFWQNVEMTRIELVCRRFLQRSLHT